VIQERTLEESKLNHPSILSGDNTFTRDTKLDAIEEEEAKKVKG
jgi:hypothetical protein